jgi:aquaporin Z
MTLGRRFAAELLGTFWLVFAGCGAAVLSATFPQVGIGMLGVGLAFGLALLTMAYAIGHISGCHLNPAVSIGLAVGGRLPGRDLPAYICAQLIGAMVAAWVLYGIAAGRAGFDLSSGLASNGFGVHSPGGYSLAACALAEVVLTFLFVTIILGATDRRVPQGFAPIPIGLALAVCNLVAIPVTNASINPARSTGPALVVGGWALQQLWLFWLAPVFGGVLAGVIYPAIARESVAAPSLSPRRAA